MASITYVDYGNSETIPLESLRILPSEFSISILESQSKEVQLAFIEIPNSDEVVMDAQENLKDRLEVGGGKFWMVEYGSVNGLPQVLLQSQKNSSNFKNSLQSDMLREGWAILKRDALKAFERKFGRPPGSSGVFGGPKQDYIAEMIRKQNGETIQNGIFSHGQKGNLLESLVGVMEEGKSGRRGLWRYGDFVGEDNL